MEHLFQCNQNYSSIYFWMVVLNKFWFIFNWDINMYKWMKHLVCSVYLKTGFFLLVQIWAFLFQNRYIYILRFWGVFCEYWVYDYEINIKQFLVIKLYGIEI